MVKKFLNVGGGNKGIPIPTYFDGWQHDLLDIDPKSGAEVVMDARNMCSLPAGQYDAVYCSHNIEHYYSHDVPKVLAGMRHVLKSDGFAEIRCPDIGTLIRLVAANNLEPDQELYVSGGGPVTVLDILYGFGPEIERSGNDYYAHKTGFTRSSLERALMRAFSFVQVKAEARPVPELRAWAFVSQPTPAALRLVGLLPTGC